MSIYFVGIEDNEWTCYANPSYDGKLNDPYIDIINKLIYVRVSGKTVKEAFDKGYDIIIKVIEQPVNSVKLINELPLSFRCDVCDSDKMYFIKILNSVETEAFSYVPEDDDNLSLERVWDTEFNSDSKTLMATCLGCEKYWGPTSTLKELEKLLIDSGVMS